MTAFFTIAYALSSGDTTKTVGTEIWTSRDKLVVHDVGLRMLLESYSAFHSVWHVTRVDTLMKQEQYGMYRLNLS